ncbi:MAG: hypothetical protein QM639_19275 [Rhodocyclaceae bacterium]
MTAMVLQDETTAPIDPRQRRRARRTLLAIFLVCLAPVLASYGAFYLWRPAARSNQGELIDPPRTVAWPTAQADALRGKWVLAVSTPGACDEACTQALYLTRQVRTAQAKEMHRVARAWVAPAAGEGAADDGLAMVADAALAAQLGERRVVLVDPLGNLVLRYPLPPDGRALNKDLARLLKYSSLGR